MKKHHDGGSPACPPLRGSDPALDKPRQRAPTHPDHGPMEDIPRQENGSIAAYYYCSREEIDGFDLGGPPPRRTRHDGWTPDRQKQFIENLATTASVSSAARLIGMSLQSAYELRNRADAGAFRAAWDEALRSALAVLAATAFERAVDGVEEKIYHQGEQIGNRTRYNDRLLMFLLRVRDPLSYAPLDDHQGWLRHRPVEPQRAIETTVDRLVAAEEEWGSRLEAAPLNAAERLLAGPLPEEPGTPTAADRTLSHVSPLSG